MTKAQTRTRRTGWKRSGQAQRLQVLTRRLDGIERCLDAVLITLAAQEIIAPEDLARLSRKKDG